MRKVISFVLAGAVLAGGSVVWAQGTYSAPKTPWGDPDLQGTYTNADENGTPMERPADLQGRLEDYGEKEMAELRAERQRRAQERARSIGGSQAEDTGAGPSHWYEHLEASNAQPWLVFDPPSGKIPPMNAKGQQRAQARRGATGGRGGGFGAERADSFTDRSLYDRCISLGVPGSMTPMIYGNAYDITQAPGYAVIRYEMIHEARVIPIGNQASLPSGIRPYMGDARGRWEGDTLVVETTNINPGTLYRGSSDKLKIIERFTPTNADTLRWEIRFEDPDTWDQSWAYTMPLKRDADHAPFEYACHEGNRGLANILSAARAEEGSN